MKPKQKAVDETSELSEKEEHLADPLLKDIAMPRSRLNRSLAQQSKKNVIFALLGIIGILLLLVFFGMPLLINLSLLFERTTGEDTKQTAQLAYIAPPVLEPAVTATNSAIFIIKGEAEKGKTVILYRNNEMIAETNSDDDGSFKFPGAELETGENIIRAKAKDGKNESDYSDQLIITYLKEPPKLEIEQPTEGREYKNSPVNVTGTTDTNVKVTVNGFWAIVDTEGKFSYSLPLQNGDNIIKILATDNAGNKAEKEIKIKYSP